MTTATMQELLDYCEMFEMEAALANTLRIEHLEYLNRVFPEPEDYEYE